MSVLSKIDNDDLVRGAIVVASLVVLAALVPIVLTAAVVYGIFLVGLVILAVKDFRTNGGIPRADGLTARERLHKFFTILSTAGTSLRFSGKKNKQNDFTVKKSDEKPVNKTVDEKPVTNAAAENYRQDETDRIESQQNQVDAERDSGEEPKEFPEWQSYGGEGGIRFTDGTPIFKEQQ